MDPKIPKVIVIFELFRGGRKSYPPSAISLPNPASGELASRNSPRVPRFRDPDDASLVPDRMNHWSGHVDGGFWVEVWVRGVGLRGQVGIC